MRLPLGLAPRIARLTLAFLPSMIGFGSLQARSAASLFDIITWKCKMYLSNYQCVFFQIANCIFINMKEYLFKLLNVFSLTKPYPRDFPVLLSVITTASSMSPYTSKYFIRMMVRMVRKLGTTMRMVTSKCSLSDLSVVW